MSKLLAGALLLTGLGAFIYAVYNEKKKHFVGVRISTDKTTYKSGEEVNITIESSFPNYYYYVLARKVGEKDWRPVLSSRLNGNKDEFSREVTEPGEFEVVVWLSPVYVDLHEIKEPIDKRLISNIVRIKVEQ